MKNPIKEKFQNKTCLNIRLLIVLFFLALVFNSCLNYEQKAKLNSDGSGTVKIHYWAKESNVISISKLSFDEAEIRNNQYAPLNVTDVKIEKKDSVVHAYINLEFNDINKLDKTQGYKDNIISLQEKEGELTLTHLVRMDTNARNIGMEEYILRYEYELPENPEKADPVAIIEGKTAKWEFRYSDLAHRDINMLVRMKKRISFQIIIIISILIMGLISGFLLYRRQKTLKKAPKNE